MIYGTGTVVPLEKAALCIRICMNQHSIRFLLDLVSAFIMRIPIGIRARANKPKRRENEIRRYYLPEPVTYYKYKSKKLLPLKWFNSNLIE
jgi:hypothetical protein